MFVQIMGKIFYGGILIKELEIKEVYILFFFNDVGVIWRKFLFLWKVYFFFYLYYDYCM